MAIFILVATAASFRYLVLPLLGFGTIAYV
ncbi:hypothetical protein JOC76_003943 [Neobacillus cucumis]|nr:hypothetical protein [Neobacillus cucumis]